jgi:hypothetical protein
MLMTFGIGNKNPKDRMHPLSVAELLNQETTDAEIRMPRRIDDRFNMEYVECDCSAESKPIRVPAKTFLLQLV